MIYLDNDLQFGYVYLHENSKDDQIYFTPPFISKAITNPKKNSMGKPRTPWPQTTNTNFRLSYVDNQQPATTNYGHSEYQLLAGGELLEMVDYAGCPVYVIVYSNIFPCITPENPDKKIPRCAVMLKNVRANFREKCPDASFYLLTERDTGNNLDDEGKMLKIMSSGIIWIHEDMNDIGPELEKWDPSQTLEPQKE